MVGETNCMVGYHLMSEGEGCLKHFLKLDLKNRCILSLRMQWNGADSYS